MLVLVPTSKSSGSASSCSLPVTYKENVDNPGQFLPGCNPVVDTNPAPMMAIAPLGVSTDRCNKAAVGGVMSSQGVELASSAQPGHYSSRSAHAGKSNGAPSGSAPTGSPTEASTSWATTFATIASSYAAASPSYGGGRHGHYGHGHGHVWPSWGPRR